MRASMLVRSARRQAGLTQRELAQRTGIPQSTIARIERDQNDPRASTLNSLLIGCSQTLIGSGFAPDTTLELSERAARHLPEITRRLADGFRPSRIILFGSQAKGQARRDSDLDLLVVVAHVEDKRQLRVAMRQAVADIPIDKDILVITEREAAAYHGRSVLSTALREGVPVYGR